MPSLPATPAGAMVPTMAPGGVIVWLPKHEAEALGLEPVESAGRTLWMPTRKPAKRIPGRVRRRWTAEDEADYQRRDARLRVLGMR